MSALPGILMIRRWDLDVLDWRARVRAAGSDVSDTNLRKVNDFVLGCKSDPSPNAGVSNWDALKQVGILCAATSLTGALIALKGTSPLINFNFVGADYSSTLGLTGDGVSKYLDFRRINSADPQNNKSLAAYVTSSRSNCLLGVGTTGTGTSQLMGSGSTLLARCNAGTLLTTSTGGINAGLYGLSRTSATNVDFVLPGTSGSVEVPVETLNPSTFVGFGRGTVSSPSSLSSSRIATLMVGEAVNLVTLGTRISTMIAALT